jgi:hypothetical protein
MFQDNKRDLANVVQWGQRLLAEVLNQGDLAVDLTAGNGHDTLALWQMVGPIGQVISCDIQDQALVETGKRLHAAKIPWRQYEEQRHIPAEAGVDLIHMNHALIGAVIPRAPMGILANLGYLPGGNQALVTRPETTLAALKSCCDLLARGGRMAVAVYPGHPGGAEEAASVCDFLTELDGGQFIVLQLRVCNRPQAPFLMMTEKR